MSGEMDQNFVPVLPEGERPETGGEGLVALRIEDKDRLTGLWNRPWIEQLLRDTLGRKDAATIILLDLDGLKEINAGFGHDVGDELLQGVAGRLPSAAGTNAVVARFGGDRFAILLGGDVGSNGANDYASQLLDELGRPFDIAGHVFHLGASAGLARAPAHGEDVEELIISADLALLRAKQSGGRTWRMFAPETLDETAARRSLQAELLRALRNEELVLHYQPQVSLNDGRMTGVEALIRWHHPKRGLLLPGDLLMALETSSLALEIGWWVLDEACRQMAVWRDAGAPVFKVGVNLFQEQFRAGVLLQQIREMLVRHRLQPNMLELEVTETVALNDDGRLLLTMRELRELGVGIAFDDFGTGYASLSSLQRFPLTTLKVDRSFVGDLLTNPQDVAITRAIITLGNELGLETIAEGIETLDQEIMLRNLGCRTGQGYRYGKAMPAEEIALLCGALRAAASEAHKADLLHASMPTAEGG